ncbi:MAG: ABC transporter permease [Calditrichia bacterium]
MFGNYLKIALRNLKRQKVYSFINIAGLAIGLACFILIILYIRYEFSYESHHLNADRIYRVNVVQQHPNGIFRLSHSMVPLGKALAEEIPEIADYARIFNYGKAFVKYQEKKFNEDNIVFTDQGFLNIFTIPVIAGNKETALTNKFSLAITESMAKKYFGDQNPVGQTLLIDNEYPLQVTAIIKDFPKNTHITAGFLVSFNTLVEIAGEDFMDNWITTNLMTYVMISGNQNLIEIENKIENIYQARATPEVKKTFELEQLRRIHLYSQVTSYGDIRNVYIFLAIGILILLIASINFMNLSTARSARRANEVGLRKVVGANQGQLIKQFIGESIFITFLALFLALFIVESFLPVFRNLTGQELIFPAASDWHFYGLLFIISLSVGFLSGSYPALYLSSFAPVSILQGRTAAGKKGAKLRRTLVILQFSIAIALIISTLSVRDQIDFMRHKGLGFQKDQIIVIPAVSGENEKDINPFRQALLSSANIRGVTGSVSLPSRIGMYNNVTWEGASENESIALIHNRVDYDFLETYEIKIVQGRNFSPEFPTDIVDGKRKNNAGAIILNEEAVRRFGWDNPIGKKVIQTYGEQRFPFTVVGVVKDFHFASLHYKIRPLSLFLQTKYPRYISVKVTPVDLQKTIEYIQKTWNRFYPEYPFEHYFLDQTFEHAYQAEQKLQTLFGYFALLSIFISCLGLLGLAAFATERRTKEIGMRKVLGASVWNIIVMLSGEFAKWILIANLIAWPVAWYVMNRWLQNFAYRIDIGWWIFALAGGLALIIALLTIISQAVKAALANPVESLRYE